MFVRKLGGNNEDPAEEEGCDGAEDGVVDAAPPRKRRRLQDYVGSVADSSKKGKPAARVAVAAAEAPDIGGKRRKASTVESTVVAASSGSAGAIRHCDLCKCNSRDHAFSVDELLPDAMPNQCEMCWTVHSPICSIITWKDLVDKYNKDKDMKATIDRARQRLNSLKSHAEHAGVVPAEVLP